MTPRGRINVTPVIAQQDYWATFYKIVEQKVAEGQLFDHPIAKDATERLQHEKLLGDS